jgi:nucleotide-binding universal stress UspA family protein
MMAAKFEAQIILMHVVESLHYSVTDTFNVVEHETALMTIARSLLDNMCQMVREKGLPVKDYLTSGTPYREILKTSNEDQVDLIIMGTHGRTGVEHFLFGSVAERVVRLARIPVLTVRHETEEETG